MARSFSAALDERYSCRKCITTLTVIMTDTTATARMSPVRADTTPSRTRTRMKGFLKLPSSIPYHACGRSCATVLRPDLVRRRPTSASVKPFCSVWSIARTVSGPASAAFNSSSATRLSEWVCVASRALRLATMTDMTASLPTCGVDWWVPHSAGEGGQGGGSSPAAPTGPSASEPGQGAHFKRRAVFHPARRESRNPHDFPSHRSRDGAGGQALRRPCPGILRRGSRPQRRILPGRPAGSRAFRRRPRGPAFA